MDSNATAAAVTAGLTVSELERARFYLGQTHILAIGAVHGLSQAQYNFKPDSRHWSIAENLEHMVTVQDRVLGPVQEQLAAASNVDYDRATVDEIVLYQFPARLAKIAAPEIIQPSGRVAPAESLKRLSENYARLERILEATPDLREHAIESMPMKIVSQGNHQWMDGYQWLLAAAAHTERHAKQILELRGHPEFPE